MKLFLLGVAVLIVGCVIFAFFAPLDDERTPLGIIMRNGHTAEELKNIYLTVDPVAQNLQQTGVNDQAIPLSTRQSWATAHGVPQPLY